MENWLKDLLRLALKEDEFKNEGIAAHYMARSEK
jgi:hypothetical protein